MRTRVPEFLAGRCRTVVFTGAGISAESGVPTFRGAGGLWEGVRPEDLATPGAFAQDPDRVWAWYSWRRELVGRCEPNGAHRALARLERSLPWFRLITQNVDGLHQRAGSGNVVELHGSLWKTRCTREGTVRDQQSGSGATGPTTCSCGALLRPHVVWFGEALDAGDMQQAVDAARQAELFLVVGTSALVHPAASLPVLAHSQGAHLVEVNLEPTALTPLADEWHQGPAAEVLPRLLAQAAD